MNRQVTFYMSRKAHNGSSLHEGAFPPFPKHRRCQPVCFYHNSGHPGTSHAGVSWPIFSVSSLSDHMPMRGDEVPREHVSLPHFIAALRSGPRTAFKLNTCPMNDPMPNFSDSQVGAPTFAFKKGGNPESQDHGHLHLPSTFTFLLHWAL